MTEKLMLLLVFIPFMGAVAQEVKPIWALGKNPIAKELQSGKIEATDKGVVLRDGAAFGVPASAFPDQDNFTVEVSLSILKLIDPGYCSVMSKEGDEDSGFSCAFNYKTEPWWARSVAFAVNEIFMYSRGLGGTKDPKLNHSYTFTMAVRGGLATLYIDGYPQKKCFMMMIPNNSPMWIGKNPKENYTSLPVIINSVKVYGADYKYVSDKEVISKNPRGVVAGKGWALDVPKVENEDWPKVLIYGDSISEGYKKFFIPEMLTHNVYVFHCSHFINGQTPKKVLEDMSSKYDFDVIVFNNGLHSLKWTPEAVSDQEVYKRMKDLADSLKKGAPQAKLYYLMTTPQTAKRPAPDKPVEKLGALNPIVIRLNRITVQVMKDENIPIIDVYTLLTKHLDWAIGDGYHWKAPAYQFISDSIEARISNVVSRCKK